MYIWCKKLYEKKTYNLGPVLSQCSVHLMDRKFRLLHLGSHSFHHRKCCIQSLFRYYNGKCQFWRNYICLKQEESIIIEGVSSIITIMNPPLRGKCNPWPPYDTVSGNYEPTILLEGFGIYDTPPLLANPQHPSLSVKAQELAMILGYCHSSFSNATECKIHWPADVRRQKNKKGKID